MMIRKLKNLVPKIHPGAYIDPQATVIGDVTVGEGSSLWPGAVARGDVHWIKIGCRTNIQDGSILHVTGGKWPLRIGDNCTIGHRAVLHGCTIGDNVLIGMGAIVLDGAVVENNAVVAAGALVPEGKTIPSGTLAMGIPAKAVRELPPDTPQRRLEQAGEYQQLWQELYAGPDSSQPARLSSETVFDSRIFKLRRDRVRMPGGLEVNRDVIEHPGAAVIVALTPEGKVLMVRQYRHAAGEFLLELPAGTLEPGEDPAAAAARELQEETGYRPGRMVQIGGFYSAPGFCSEFLYCFLAEDLTPSRLECDPDEQIEAVEVPVDEAWRMAASGEIRDAKTLAGLMLALGPAGPGHNR